jgi:uncharacterized protein (DUF934 family)
MKFLKRAPERALTVANDADVQTLAADLIHAPTVVLHFPKWVDGRAYSQAVTLRRRLRYRGDIVATGEVVADMLPLLARTGFTAVQLAEGQSETIARETLAGFERGHYQGDIHETRPWFLRGANA